MMATATQPGAADSAGILALLDLPAGSVLNLDGETVVLKRDDFVGFHSIPCSSVNSGDRFIFHAVTVRAGAAVSGTADSCRQQEQGACATTVGFVFLWEDETNATLVHRYDPLTEEVSSKSEEKTVVSNLRHQILMGRIEPQRVVSYHQFMSQTKAVVWNDLTSLVSKRLLRRRGIDNGSKLVPGSYCDDTDLVTETDTTAKVVDGISVTYPPIPVLDASHSTRHTLHTGTKRFMKELAPAVRTAFFTAANPASLALEHLLTNEYGDQFQDLLGEVQLSYILFLNLHCFSSLTHWRDLVALLSSVEAAGMIRRSELYESLLHVLVAQVATMEEDFFDDVECSGDNFLVPALQQLNATATKFVTKSSSSLAPTLAKFTKMLQEKFPSHFRGNHDMEDQDDDPSRHDEPSKMILDDTDSDNESWADEDGPVVVSTEEVEASITRSLELSRRQATRKFDLAHDTSLVRAQYPLLFAAMDPNTEDVLMTCARALDEAVDVSLVREAAAYLEEVEAKRI